MVGGPGMRMPIRIRLDDSVTHQKVKAGAVRRTQFTRRPSRRAGNNDDPDYFSARRKPNRYTAIGTGEHFCLGGTLARAELRLLYEELLRSTSRIELDGTPTMLNSIIANGLEILPVRLVPDNGDGKVLS
jgi:hypothetical protein